MSREVKLRDVTAADVPIFFEHQLDMEAIRMAAFTAEDPADQDAFMARWGKILADDTIAKKTILFEGHVVGHLVSFERFGKPEVSYWIDRQYWGKGLATRALSKFLSQLQFRPLYARAASDNIASIRVLEKCGFKVCGYERAFASARGEEIDEVVFTLTERAGEQPSLDRKRRE